MGQTICEWDEWSQEMELAAFRFGPVSEPKHNFSWKKNIDKLF